MKKNRGSIITIVFYFILIGLIIFAIASLFAKNDTENPVYSDIVEYFQNEQVKEALENQMFQLKEQMNQSQTKVQSVEISVGTHEFERNLDQGRGDNSQGQEPSRRGRVRRLNLNDPMTAEEPEEEDMLAKDMMEANGNTVDYSV